MTVLLFSCCDKNKTDNPPVIETPAAQFTSVNARLNSDGAKLTSEGSVKGGINTVDVAEEGKYQMEGIWLKWLGRMYPEHGDYELMATQNPGRWYYIVDFRPTCVDPDYIQRKIEVEILGTIPRYATPDIGLKYGNNQTRSELTSSRWKLNVRSEEGSAKDYYYALWNYTKNPECTWFPRNPYKSYYNQKTGEVYDIDINPADLRGRRIQTWDYNLAGALYDYDPSKWITSYHPEQDYFA